MILFLFSDYCLMILFLFLILVNSDSSSDSCSDSCYSVSCYSCSDSSDFLF